MDVKGFSVLSQVSQLFAIFSVQEDRPNPTSNIPAPLRREGKLFYHGFAQIEMSFIPDTDHTEPERGSQNLPKR